MHYDLIHKEIPMKTAMTIPKARAAVDAEWDKLAGLPAWDLNKMKPKAEVVRSATRRGIDVHFGSLRDLCHLKNSELAEILQRYKGRVVFRGILSKINPGTWPCSLNEVHPPRTWQQQSS